MTLLLPKVTCAALAMAAVATSQSPTLFMPASVPLVFGSTITTTTFLPAGSAYATFVDIDAGPTDILGERLYLGLSPAFATFDSGIAAASTVSKSATLPIFPGLLGTVIYGQSLVLDASAANGLFRVSNGASSALHGGNLAIVETFQGTSSFTGTYAQGPAGYLQGGPVTTRTATTINAQGVLFAQPIQSPLVPSGARQQIVFRTQELGSTGEPELVTGVRWKPASTSPVQFETFQSFDMRIGHSAVVPDYTIDPWTALPTAPNSGLSENFASNEIAGAAPQPVYNGSYTIRPTDVTANGYLPYPMFAPFAYDGTSSMLFDFRVLDQTAAGLNGMQVRLMVQSSAMPGTRVVATGNGLPPGSLTSGVADNAMPDFEIDFTRVQTYAQSGWQPILPTADFGTPVVAAAMPFGTTIEVLYRGTDSPGISTPTAWSTSPDIAEGHNFLQYRVNFVANRLTGEVPLIDTLVIPIQ